MSFKDFYKEDSISDEKIKSDKSVYTSKKEVVLKYTKPGKYRSTQPSSGKLKPSGSDGFEPATLEQDEEFTVKEFEPVVNYYGVVVVGIKMLTGDEWVLPVEEVNTWEKI